MNIVYFEGVKATVPQFKFKFLATAILAVSSLVFIACGPPAGPGTSQDETYATVNGKAIKMQEVERIIKQQTGGTELKISDIERAQARLQVLLQLIQQEALYQKAEQEKTLPSDEEVNTEFGKLKTGTGQSAEDFEKKLKEAGETEATIKDGIKKQLAIKKLLEKITGKVDAPKDSEIDAFYKGSPEAFVKKKGVKLAAIVIDPRKNGDTDTTVDEPSAALKIKEIATQLNQGADFAAVAREKSEDGSAQQGGDLGYVSEEQLKQNYPQLVGLMNPEFTVGKLAGPINIEGRYFIFKLQERSDKDETVTLESPGIRQQVIDTLTNGRKALVQQAYMAQVMNEAKIDNLLIKKIVNNPNELSGARPASTPDANANTNANTAPANTANANTKPANAPANTKPAANATKPAANTATAPKANANK